MYFRQWLCRVLRQNLRNHVSASLSDSPNGAKMQSEGAGQLGQLTFVTDIGEKNIYCTPQPTAAIENSDRKKHSALPFASFLVIIVEVDVIGDGVPSIVNSDNQ